jgi:hypothetical protein
MKDFDECDEDFDECDEALRQRAHDYVERLREFALLDDAEAKLFKCDLISHLQYYATKHRFFGGLDDHGVKLTWLTALSFVLAGDASLMLEWEDAAAELLLRGLQPPCDEVNRVVVHPYNRERRSTLH